MHDDDVPVLISGGSLVGLSTSLFLAWHGIPSLVVERHRGTAIHPRAALFSQRTIELYRSVGLQEAIIEASDREFVQNGAIMSVESLGGRELEWYFRHINDGVDGLSSSPRLFITQIGLEPILRSRAEELGARLEYASELVSFEQDGEGVTAVVKGRDGGAERTVRARYLVAADGSRSSVREHLGIQLRGRGSFSNSITIYFRAGVRELIGDRSLSVIYVFHPRLQGFFRFSKAGDAGFLVVNATLDASGARNRDLWDDTSEERCVEHVRVALGAPDLPVEIETCSAGSHPSTGPSASPTAASFSRATPRTRCRRRAASAATPACRTVTTSPGSSPSSSVEPPVPRCFKPTTPSVGLLANSPSSRRTRATSSGSIPSSARRTSSRTSPSTSSSSATGIARKRYSPKAAEVGELIEDPHEPSGRPGLRAPHLLVDRDGEQVSTLDLLGRSFVLLAGPDGESWRVAAGLVAAGLGTGLDAHRIETPGFAEVYGTGPEGAVLVRPDGFIAWRARAAADDAELVLADALRRVLARPT